ncbi:lipoprotein [Streptomyces lavendofoliae]|uniref:Lipoprotein n=1 Tax=Streptomyces lavendofoliae TaxID=67314 RepID=A0A918HSF3_9ACTN|nr:lipoprotein [Streptomyces lavendofoliae]
MALLTAVLVALALPAAAACGTGGEDPDAAPETATGTLEELAAKVACDPNIQTDAEEIRQANCRTKEGAYVLATFATDRGQREWINEANDYGGAYLVGRKWVAVGEEKVVTALRDRLGGEVEAGSAHHSGSGGGAGEHEGERDGKGGHDGHSGRHGS